MSLELKHLHKKYYPLWKIYENKYNEYTFPKKKQININIKININSHFNITLNIKIFLINLADIGKEN